MSYYNLDNILKEKDAKGNEPGVYLINTNRSGGKTTALLKHALENNDKGEEVVIIYRHNYELCACSELFLDVLQLFRPNAEIEAKAKAKGLFYKLIYKETLEDGHVDERDLGYAVSLNNTDAIKKYSPMFREVTLAIFDEYQKEDGKYLKSEVDLLLSLMVSISRGGGHQSRKVKLFLLGNNVSLLNPYYIHFGIYKRLSKDTHFLRGDGWISEHDFIESAARAIGDNPVTKALGKKQLSYLISNDYLIDTTAFICKPKGKSAYLFTIVTEDGNFGVREFYEEGVIHVSEKQDPSCTTRLVFKAENHTQNTMLLETYSFTWRNIRNAFNNGYLTFDSVKSKNVIMELLAIDIY